MKIKLNLHSECLSLENEQTSLRKHILCVSRSFRQNIYQNQQQMCAEHKCCQTCEQQTLHETYSWGWRNWTNDTRVGEFIWVFLRQCFFLSILRQFSAVYGSIKNILKKTFSSVGHKIKYLMHKWSTCKELPATLNRFLLLRWEIKWREKKTEETFKLLNNKLNCKSISLNSSRAVVTLTRSCFFFFWDIFRLLSNYAAVKLCAVINR